ncbi:MAG: sugar phosphate nucleotidyltransferase [candidate division WOR-3 bacterium]
MEAIILCAGFGRRLRPLTKTIPKPLLKFHNKTLLTHNILKLFEIGTERLFINAYYLSEKIRNFIKDIYGIEIVFYEELEILGTGGGVYSFKNFIKNDFFIITNSDIYHQIDLSKAIKFHIENKAFITLILKDDFKNNVIVENLRVLDFCEEIKKSAYTFTGISIVSKKFFNYLEYKCSLIDGFKKAILNNEKVLGYITSEFWKDALELEIS